MKRFSLLLLSTLLLLLLTACGPSEESDPHPAQMGNPWTDCETPEDAVGLAGFDIAVPDSIAGYDAPVYRVMSEKMLEVLYPAENGELRIRKQAATNEVGNDISGDYNDYQQHAAITTREGADVILDGNDDTISRALWTIGGYAYSVTVQPGIDIGAMSEIIAAIK